MTALLQTDLFTPQATGESAARLLKSGAQAALEAMSSSGGYIGPDGRIVLLRPPEWTRRLPDRVGYWLSSDGRAVMVHRAIRLGGGLHVLGTHDLACGLGLTTSLDRLKLDWFGPIGAPPNRDWSAPDRTDGWERAAGLRIENLCQERATKW